MGCNLKKGTVIKRPDILRISAAFWVISKFRTTQPLDQVTSPKSQATDTHNPHILGKAYILNKKQEGEQILYMSRKMGKKGCLIFSRFKNLAASVGASEERQES